MNSSTTTQAPFLEAINLGKTVGTPPNRLTILQNLNLQVNRGESVAIVGASGSGKSTLLALLAGLDTPSTGHVRLEGQSLQELDEDQLARLRSRCMGFVFQSFQLLPALTALENVMLPLELQTSVREAREKARHYCEQVGIGHRLDHFPAQLSGGEQQRVALARAFVTEPALLLADEPTGNLDHSTGQRVMDLLFDLNQKNRTTLLLVTHDTELASRCRRSVRMTDGTLQAA